MLNETLLLTSRAEPSKVSKRRYMALSSVVLMLRGGAIDRVTQNRKA